MQATKKKAVRRFHAPLEAAQISEDKRHLREKLDSPLIQDKAGVRAALSRIEKMEAQHGVPDLTPEQRTQAAKQVKELEEQIKHGMLTSEEMRRNPPGAVDQNVAWERRNKARIMRRRNLLLAIHKGMPADECQQLTTIERLRPTTNSFNMDNAQIPAIRTYDFPSEQFKANYDQINWAKDEPSVLDEEEEESVAESILEDPEDAAGMLQELGRRRR